ncbi:MAG: hypothetical protein L0H74_00590 [Brachybacterium sp.]|nr:hypothetical protein [Brachybacterium sp.]
MRNLRGSYAKPAAVLVVIVGLITVAVVLGVRNAPQSDQASAEGSTRSASSSKQVTPPAAPPEGVQLPEGASSVEGHPTQFPYTDLGAVATTVAVARAQVGFDYDQAAGIADTYASEDDRDTFEQRGAKAVTDRRAEAGVTQNGQIPPATAYAVTPVAFTVDELDTDYYAVNVLSYVTLTTATSATKDFLYSGTQLLTWEDGDWKLVRGSDEDHQQLLEAGQPQPAAPGSAAFDRSGWILLNAEQQ